MPSYQHGCQYLHAPIPGYEYVPRVTVSYELNGTPAEYRAKVYGETWHGQVSPEDFIGEHDAWDIRQTYRDMWTDLFVRRDIPALTLAVTARELPLLRAEYGAIISTVPMPALCEGGWLGHVFQVNQIFAAGTRVPEHVPANRIICDGTAQHSWYRKSQVFGYSTIEWPGSVAIKKQPARSVRVGKPLWTDCTCHPDVIHAGRYGAWKKSVLVHQVPGEVEKALNERSG